jgi:NADH:ubiquinone oxidoreductase subunit 2 (subunit N)
MSFFFAIELQSLTLYILVATKQNSALSTEAALKYFTIGSFSSTLMLFGISFLYGVTGLISFNDLRLFMSYNYNNLGVYSNLFILGFSLFLVGILFKVGAAPFHI